MRFKVKSTYKRCFDPWIGQRLSFLWSPICASDSDIKDASLMYLIARLIKMTHKSLVFTEKRHMWHMFVGKWQFFRFISTPVTDQGLIRPIPAFLLSFWSLILERIKYSNIQYLNIEYLNNWYLRGSEVMNLTASTILEIMGENFVFYIAALAGAYSVQESQRTQGLQAAAWNNFYQTQNTILSFLSHLCVFKLTWSKEYDVREGFLPWPSLPCSPCSLPCSSHGCRGDSLNLSK